MSVSINPFCRFAVRVSCINAENHETGHDDVGLSLLMSNIDSFASGSPKGKATREEIVVDNECVSRMRIDLPSR